MAKVKNVKAKKEKVKDLGPKPKWRGWMTVLATVGGVTLVSGATVLGVFLTGGFEEKVVSPESIAFGYGEGLFNDQRAQIEVTDSDKDGQFQLVIQSPTLGVTQKRVALSFDPSENNQIITTGDYISNSIIQVPRYVNIGQPFSVKLLTEILRDEEGNKITDKNGADINWIKGGVSTLYAESENEDISAINLQIAVDTPVFETETVVYDSNGSQIELDAGNYNVLAGEAFTVDTKFIPAKSEFMYGDDSVIAGIAEEDQRKKHSFFEAKLLASQANAIIAQYDSKYKLHFTAANKLFADPISLHAYTFKYADAEIEFAAANEGKGDIEFYRQATTTLSKDVAKSVVEESKVLISQATIGEFSMRSTTAVNLVRGKSTKLYIDYNKDEPAFGYLGANVLSNTNPPRELENMFKQIGIRFTLNGKDVTTGTDKLITIKNATAVQYDLNKDGTGDEVFYLPYSGGANMKKAYWDIEAATNDSATEDQVIKMEVVLFTSVEETVSAYSKNEAEGVVVLDSKALVLTNREEYGISWVDASRADISLEYTAQGFKPTPINLASFINVPNDKEIVFFADFGAVAADADGGIDKVLGKASYTKKQTFTPSGSNVDLYILTSDKITLYDTGKFDIYFASVNPLVNQESEAYIELWCNEKKSFSCQKALYEDSVSGVSITLPTAAATDNFFYSYIGAKTDSQRRFIVDFEIQADSYPSFAAAIAAGAKFEAKLYDSVGNDITPYFEVYNDKTDPDYRNEYIHIVDLKAAHIAAGNPEATFTGNQYAYYYRVEYMVKDSAVVQSSLTINKGDGAKEYAQTALLTRAELSYNKTPADEQNDLVWGGETKNNFDFEKQLYIYNPQTETITVNKNVDTSTDKISVAQTLADDGSGKVDFKTSISHGANIYETEIALVAALADGVVITDQHGNTTSLAGKWMFETKQAEFIQISDNKQSFVFGTTEGQQEATLTIKSQDNGKEATFVGLTDKVIYNFTLQTTGVKAIKVGDGGAVTGTTLAEVTYDGIQSQLITIQAVDSTNNLVQFYLDDAKTTSYYPNATYTLSAATTSSLADKKADLFGTASEEGWLTMKDIDGNRIYADGNVLTAENGGSINKIASIKANQYFAETVTLAIEISATGVNTTLRITIQGGMNETGSAVYGAAIDGESNYEVYAGFDYTSDETTKDEKTISNSLRRKGTALKSLLALYQTEQYIIYSQSKMAYVLAADCGDESPVGKIVGGVITFFDFWNKESETYTIHFAPEGENAYAAKKDIQFTVYRNIQIKANSNNVEGNNIPLTYDEDKEGTLYLYGKTGGSEIYSAVSSYISVERIKGEKKALSSDGEKDLDEIFVVGTAADASVSVNGTTFERTQDAIMSFNHATELSFNVIISTGGTNLATVPLKVQLFEDVYQTVASMFGGTYTVEGEDTPATAKVSVQEINGIKYIVLDDYSGSTSWAFSYGQIAAGIATPSKISIAEKRTIGSETISSSLYTANPVDDTNKQQGIRFKKNGVLYGYNSKQYLLVKFEGTNAIEWIYLPVIISYAGTTPVKYEGVDEKDAINTALMTPDELISNKIYREVIAGQNYTLSFTDYLDADARGLYFTPYSRIEFYSGAGAANTKIQNRLGFNLLKNSNGVTLDIYDLADNNGDKEYYIAFNIHSSLNRDTHKSFIMYLRFFLTFM